MAGEAQGIGEAGQMGSRSTESSHLLPGTAVEKGMWRLKQRVASINCGVREESFPSSATFPSCPIRFLEPASKYSRRPLSGTAPYLFASHPPP